MSIAKWLSRLTRKRFGGGEVLRVPNARTREMMNQRDDLYGVLRLVDGLLSQGQVKEAQSQVRIALIANGRPRTPEPK